MDSRTYNRLLLLLLLLPLLALAILAAALGYSLHQVESGAAWLDHSDQVVAHVSRLVQLIVDEETGVRGYFLTHDHSFLEPYTFAERELPQQFETTLGLLRDSPAQTARLQELRRRYTLWQVLTRRDVRSGVLTDMLARKTAMDNIRTQAGLFLQAEERLRAERAARVRRLDASARERLTVVLILVGLWIAWITVLTFSRLRKTYQAQLAETQRQHELADAGQRWLETTMRSIGDGVIACDAQGRIVFLNPVAATLTGWSEEETKGVPLPVIFRLVHEKTRATVEGPVETVLRTGGVVAMANHTLLIRKDGTECGVDDSAAPIRDENGRLIGIVLVFRDSSDRRRTQSALMRAEKLAVAGKLAATIAHEVNNPLEGITNMLFLASGSADLEESRNWLTQAQSEVRRLSHITRRTLGFYRESTQPVGYSPAAVVEEVISFYTSEALSKKVELQSQLRSRQQTYGVPGEMRQVLSNLIANSLDAMPNGGIVRIAVRDATDVLDGGTAGVRITVADTGSGIPSNVLGFVFDPFFTTKLDTGTGLGLWVSKELIEKQGGRLRVRSSVSGPLTGTAFSIFVPLHPLENVAAQNDLRNDAIGMIQ